jgi:hypothetical protein
MRVLNVLVAVPLLATGLVVGCSGASGGISPLTTSPSVSSEGGGAAGKDGAGGGKGGGQAPDAGGGVDAFGAADAIDSGSPLATVSEFCAVRAADECSAAVVKACALSSQSACKSVRTKACMASVPPGTTYEPSDATACLNAVTSTYATGTLTPTALAAEASACGPVLFAGPGVASTPCKTDYDCDSVMNLSCIFPTPFPPSDMGACMTPVVVALGSDCGDMGSVCGPGAYCDPETLMCITDAPMGAGCNPSFGYPCAAGLVCQDAGSPFATCIAAASDGATCHADADCASGLCDMTTATDAASGTCTSSIVLSSIDRICAMFE